MKINIILLSIACLMTVIQSQSTKDSDYSIIKLAIDSQNAAYNKAYNNKDAESVGALHTIDATVMPPNQKIAQGRKEIINATNAEIQAGAQDLKFESLELVVSGDIAYETGLYSLNVKPKGQESFSDNGKVILIWKRQSNDEWLIDKDIWNSDLPIDCN